MRTNSAAADSLPPPQIMLVSASLLVIAELDRIDDSGPHLRGAPFQAANRAPRSTFSLILSLVAGRIVCEPTEEVRG